MYPKIISVTFSSVSLHISCLIFTLECSVAFLSPFSCQRQSPLCGFILWDVFSIGSLACLYMKCLYLPFLSSLPFLSLGFSPLRKDSWHPGHLLMLQEKKHNESKPGVIDESQIASAIHCSNKILDSNLGSASCCLNEVT